MARKLKPGEPRPARKDRHGMDPVKAGVLMLAVLTLFTYFGFRQDIPFRSGFELRAVVADAVSIRQNSPVRIAGVNVGKVVKVEPYGEGDGTKRASVVVMELKDEALPIHKDATIKIRPRIFLEGNWFVDLRPGTPASPRLESGDSLPITQAAAPVQFDQILTILQSDTRADLKLLLTNYGKALTYEPTAADDVTQDPMVWHKSAAEALNMSLDDAAPGLKGAAEVNEALLGENRRDLSRLIAATAKVTAALGRDDNALKGFVTNLNRTSAALAAERENLQESVALLGPTVANANDTFAALGDALPDIRALALELVPGVEESGPTIDAAMPWIEQVTKLVGDDELGGVAEQLTPTTRSLAELGAENMNFLPQADLVAQCITDYVLPLGNIKVDDGAFSTGVENYKEFWYTVVGFNGEGQNFDGNGYYLRFQLGGGQWAWATGPYQKQANTPGVFQQWARSNKPPLGTRPAYPGKQPAYVSDKNCKSQALPAVNGKPAGPADGQAPGGSPAKIYVPPAPVATTTSGKLKAADSRSADVTSELIGSLNPFQEGAER